MAAGETTQGRRREDGTEPWNLEPADYAFRGGERGERFLWVVLPDGAGPARLEGWHVDEHDDGTVTVSPSILDVPDNGLQGWHGYLERGVWREV